MEELLRSLAGKRVFLEYRKADGSLTERCAKLVKVRDDQKVVIWCEKRNGLRTLNLSGVLSVLPLTSEKKRVL